MPPPSIHGFRRAILFLLATGLPICAGIWFSQPAGALMGCVCGLLFSFSDDEGALGKRFAILGMAAAAIALGGAAGLLLRGVTWPLWVLFAALTFATGMANSIGKAPTISARFCAMALVVTSTVPEFSLAELLYPLGALVVVALARAVDHLLAGPLIQQRPGPRTIPAGGWTRFALAYAAAATASLWIGSTIDPHRVLWVVVTTLVVMQSDARASYVRIVQRIVGTVIGVIAAFAVTSTVQSPWLIAACVLMVAPLIPHHLQHRYWLHTALIALLVLLAYDLTTFDARIMHGLLTERLQDVLIGGGLALIGTVLAFPRNPPDDA
jgi:hypothetical protein